MQSNSANYFIRRTAKLSLCIHRILLYVDTILLYDTYFNAAGYSHIIEVLYNKI